MFALSAKSTHFKKINMKSKFTIKTVSVGLLAVRDKCNERRLNLCDLSLRIRLLVWFILKCKIISTLEKPNKIKVNSIHLKSISKNEMKHTHYTKSKFTIKTV